MKRFSLNLNDPLVATKKNDITTFTPHCYGILKAQSEKMRADAPGVGWFASLYGMLGDNPRVGFVVLDGVLTQVKLHKVTQVGAIRGTVCLGGQAYKAFPCSSTIFCSDGRYFTIGLFMLEGVSDLRQQI